MKILPASDLHLEFHSSEAQRHAAMKLVASCFASNTTPQETVLVLAGDIIVAGYPLEQYDEFFDTVCSRFKAVIMVCGNHEFFGTTWEYAANQIRKRYEDMYANFQLLDNQIGHVDNVAFVGSTLYTNFWQDTLEDKAHRAAMSYATSMINDFHKTRKENGMLVTPYDWRYEHNKSLEWLDDTIAQFSRRKDKELVVVTHWTPYKDLCWDKYRGDMLNPYFVNDIDDRYDDMNIKMWVYGHQHNRDITIRNNTAMITQCVGYHYQNADFFMGDATEGLLQVYDTGDY